MKKGLVRAIVIVVLLVLNTFNYIFHINLGPKFVEKSS